MHTTRSARSRGFSLLEMMAAVVIMMIVIAVAVKGMIMMQTRNFAETAKVDTVQESRDFIDQMVHDVHNVGYPPPTITPNATCQNIAGVACGIVQFTPTQIKYEADLDGGGTVYQVWMQLIAPASGNCPCILQRGVLSKQAVLSNPAAVPDYYTEVNGVLNSGDGTNVSGGSGSPTGNATYTVSLPGGGSYTTYSTADVFDAYDANGAFFQRPVTGNYSCYTVSDCMNIRSLQITVNVAPGFMDQTTHVFPVFSITSKARLNNPPTT
jgi:type II secretory pathway pseudopilin PulG